MYQLTYHSSEVSSYHMAFTRPNENIAHLELGGTERVAVFGSGAGGHTFALVEAMGGNGQVYAVDVRAEMLAKVESDAAQRHLSGLRTKTANFEIMGGTGLGTNSFDAVVVPNTLFAASDKLTMLKEAHRILKPKGKLMIVDWSDSFGGMGPQAQHVVNAAAAKELAQKVGFTVGREFMAGAQHYGLICTK